MKKHKFFAKPVEIDGIRFASQKEGKRYNELKLLQRAGQISKLTTQPRYKFPELDYPKEYRADFEYEENGKWVIEDVKGMKSGTAYTVFRMKKALMKYFHNIEVIEI